MLKFYVCVNVLCICISVCVLYDLCTSKFFGGFYLVGLFHWFQ